ncbi:hypothetical protein [Lactococcus garvieae]|uniref:hypothetical protein n=1 Tax=Lactococcus garvieae TaxID=1363 RepID=UPI001F518FA9|nr:hypothetical protein [Lactococcus garvieae]
MKTICPVCKEEVSFCFIEEDKSVTINKFYEFNNQIWHQSCYDNAEVIYYFNRGTESLTNIKFLISNREWSFDGEILDIDEQGFLISKTRERLTLEKHKFIEGRLF